MKDYKLTKNGDIYFLFLNRISYWSVDLTNYDGKHNLEFTVTRFDESEVINVEVPFNFHNYQISHRCGSENYLVVFIPTKFIGDAR